jgi:hypothetical protein
LLCSLVGTAFAQGGQSTPSSLRRLAASAYAHRYGVSLGQARRVLALQARGHGLDAALRRRLGRRYVGAWFDNARRRWDIAIRSGAGLAGVRAQLAARRLTRSRIERVAAGSSSPDDAIGQLQQQLATYLAAGAITLGEGQGARVIVSMADDLPSQDQEHVRAVVDAIGVAATVAVVPRAEVHPSPAACSDTFCDPPLVAGVKYAHDDGSSCTTGFAVHSPVDPAPFILTAGHCIRTGLSVWTCSVTGGVVCSTFGVDYSGYYGGGDGGLIKVTNPSWPTYAAWYNYPSQELPVLGSESAAIGEFLCHTGTVTRTTCGTVSAKNVSVTYSDGTALSGMTRVDGSCINAGDSGGPFINPNTGIAAGITSGGVFGCSTVVYYEEVQRALQLLGVQLDTA